MTVLMLIVLMVVLGVALWYARQVPAPFSYIIYGVVTLVVVIVLLQVTGVASSGALTHRLG